MDPKKEKIYTKNNVARWAHCLLRRTKYDPTKKAVYYHYHDYIELLYFISGEGTVLINDNQLPVSPGSTVIINSQKAHATRLTTDAEFYCIKFLPSVLYDNEQSLWAFNYVLPFVSEEEDNYVLSREETADTPIGELLAEIMDEWNSESYAYELVIRANILKIISLVFRAWEKAGVAVKSREIPDVLRKAVVHTIENYQSVTMQSTSDACGLSYNYFSYLFNEYFGMNYSNYLISVRVKEAEKMLISSARSITDIAEETGFSSTSHFISAFRKIKGTTPAKFRRELHAQNGVEHRAY